MVQIRIVGACKNRLIIIQIIESGVFFLKPVAIHGNCQGVSKHQEGYCSSY